VDREAKVLAAINKVAGAEGVPVALRHVCVACTAAVKASGVGLYLVGERAVGRARHRHAPNDPLTHGDHP
jgi:hypothetical protein